MAILYLSLSLCSPNACTLAWIADTGIAEQRDTIKEKEATMTLKQKTRERVQPKMGKIDIDYQKLHDAFFKFQSKPSMSGFGEAYYEGKELETDLRMKRPGDISEELKEALSIPPMAPPPWLIAMQRFGPPPSYPNLRIPGLNAPIPPGCQWGFHAGGWGRPPVDEYNRPLYGDPFGVMQQQEQQAEEQIDKELWGQLEPEQEGESRTVERIKCVAEISLPSESEEEESDEEAEEDQEDLLTTGHEPADGFETPSGLDTPGGMQSVVSTVPAGLETPDFMQLRKEARAESDVSSTPMPRELYQVIPERQTSAKGFMGSSTAYDVAAVTNPSSAAGPRVLGQEDRGSKVRLHCEANHAPQTLTPLPLLSFFPAAQIQRRRHGTRSRTTRRSLARRSSRTLRCRTCSCKQSLRPRCRRRSK